MGTIIDKLNYTKTNIDELKELTKETNLSNVVAKIKERYRELPSEYQEVEYIESTGTQYIDTKFKPNQDTGLDMKLYSNNTNTNYNSPFGVRATNTKQFFIGIQTDDTNYSWFFRYGTATYKSNYGNKYGENIININKNIFSINNSTYTFASQTFQSDVTMYLFAQNNANSSVKRNFIGKIYYCKIYNNDILVRDFIPCYRKSDNEIGMYDIVNDEFYTNSGTGTFLKGADVI